MISDSDRVTAIELINEARASGCRLKPACDELNISVRTYERWTKEGEVKKDQRPLIKRPTPKNKLTKEERDEIIKTVNSLEYADLAPSQIVPKLADKGRYIASESTIYKILKAGRPLVLHSDNGSPMKAATFQATLEKLGVQSSFSRPRVSNDNPYSESLFKTMKYRPKYPFKGFRSLVEARKWVGKFVNWYNKIHLHSGIKFLTPYQRHYGLDEEIMIKRNEIYEKARAKHPERWSKNTRNWILPEYVSLNPIDEEEANNILNKIN